VENCKKKNPNHEKFNLFGSIWGVTAQNKREKTMVVPENYRGREQAFVKHRLLKTYLERLFMIIGLSQPVIRYVDCFSGPWNEKDEQLKDTSIGISLGIMKKCLEGLRGIGRNVTFHALFIEKDRRAFEKLDVHLKATTMPGISTTAHNGEFFDLRNEILRWCGQDDFVFFFIDPKGWKNIVEIPTLEPLLKRPNSEFLINFMYDFVLRTHTQESFQDEMKAIFGKIPDTASLNPKQKDKHLINLYRSKLKEIAPLKGGKPRTAYVPILYPVKDRTYYHLVYLTRHPKGIIVFMEASEKLDPVQHQVREKAKQEKRENRTRQLELFDSADDTNVVVSVDIENVKTYLLKIITGSSMRFGIEKLADMMEETGWFERNFQTAFKELFTKGILVNIDDKKGRRRKNHVNFEANRNKGEEVIRLTP